MRYIILLAICPLTVLAETIPDFNCWDIRGHELITTESSLFVTRYYNKRYESYIYVTAPDDKTSYWEYNISINEEDGFNYGSMYRNEDGSLAYDIKCKRI